MQEWLISAVEGLGELGVGLLMLLENLVPPIPSELIMPLAGYLSEQGHMSFALAIVAGTLGSFGGAVGWYILGRRLGKQQIRDFARRRGRFFGLCPSDVDRSEAWFRRHGAVAVFVGRLVPGLRAVISVPAGMARMPWALFLVCTGAGTLIWVAALAALGRFLGARFEAVDRWIGPVSWVVVGGALAWYVYRVVRVNRS